MAGIMSADNKRPQKVHKLGIKPHVFLAGWQTGHFCASFVDFAAVKVSGSHLFCTFALAVSVVRYVNTTNKFMKACSKCGSRVVFILSLLALMIVGVGFAACTAAEDAGEELPADVVTVGQSLPAFSVVTTEGRTVAADSLRGRAAVICFFTTTCSDCRKALPTVQRLYDTWGDRVTFLCIGREQAADEVTAYWAENGFSLPVSPQTNRAVYNLFARRAVPRLYVVDATGIVRATYVESVGYKEVSDVLQAL